MASQVEEEKKEEKPAEDLAMQADGEEEEGWGGGDDEDGEEGGGWYDEYDEEEENDIVKQALEATRKKKELDEQIEKSRISFRPPGFREGNIARIVGDFTDWIPVTMSMHPVKDIDEDASKRDEFFVDVKLHKGYRYRFSFEVDGVETVDTSGASLKSANKDGRLTNYIEVGDQMTVQDFMQQ